MVEGVEGLVAANSSPTPLGSATVFTASVVAGSSVSYTWDFGDDEAASEQNPEHTYAAVGVYTAVVTASNAANSQTDMTEVTVVDQPIRGLLVTNDSPTTLGNATTFTATVLSGSNVRYCWVFGDGGADIGASVHHALSQSRQLHRRHHRSELRRSSLVHDASSRLRRNSQGRTGAAYDAGLHRYSWPKHRPWSCLAIR